MFLESRLATIQILESDLTREEITCMAAALLVRDSNEQGRSWSKDLIELIEGLQEGRG